MPHTFDVLVIGDAAPDVIVGTTAQPTRDDVLSRPSETEETPV
ncbi:hypothetical protein ACWDE0_25835 [Streptomyces sp. 900105755]|nr:MULTISPECIES: hypothetical protein [Streptomyces]RPE46978.1 hypothetical protein EDD90_10386 [Streptomyces sp. Ag109_O5-1]SEF17307.1 hypothetical protein SAMN05216533_8260 [Streptomyces sp. Ag109_O5-10]